MVDFNEQLPDWPEAGIEPPASKKTAGWAVDDKPPAGWLNWFFNRTYKALLEIRSVFTAHKADTNVHLTSADKVLASNMSSLPTTGGSATAYTVSISAGSTLVAGLRFSFKAHAASGTNPTINPNSLGAKPIKKPNGNNPLLALGGVYTVVYDGSVFILQGEGGEYGTAVAADVLEGTTIGTESGVVSGTLPNLADQDVGGYISTAGSGYLGVVANSDENGVVGKITDSTTIICNDASLIPANFLAGKTVLGMAGIATSEPTVGAAAGDIVASKAATVNGNRIVGTLVNRDPTSVAEPAVNAVYSVGNLYVRIPPGAYKTPTGSGYPEVKVSTAQLLAGENNFNAAVLKEGVTAFGVTGQLKPRMLMGTCPLAGTATSFTSYTTGSQIILPYVQVAFPFTLPNRPVMVLIEAINGSGNRTVSYWNAGTVRAVSCAYGPSVSTMTNNTIGLSTADFLLPLYDTAGSVNGYRWTVFY